MDKSPKETLVPLCTSIRRASVFSVQHESFPTHSLRLCAQAGILDPQKQCTSRTLYEIAKACVPTAFVLSQFRGAVERIHKGGIQQSIQDSLAKGECYATLGISQLSTSHQHKPSLIATQTSKGWMLDGFAPWVTGAHHAEYVVLGAKNQSTMESMLFCVHRSHLSIGEAAVLTALGECDTAPVSIHTEVPPNTLFVFPKTEPLVNTGSMRSIAIALGVVDQSIAVLEEHAHKRPFIQSCVDMLQKKKNDIASCLEDTNADCLSLRTQVNQLALDSAQKALVATKGKGFLQESHASRLCRQALFFLVWSCPEEVQYQHLGSAPL